MAIINSVLGVSAFPHELRNLSLKFLVIQIIVSGVYLSHAWISMYYINILDSFQIFGFVVAIGMLLGSGLDLPLGLLTDRIGQKVSFCFASFFLMVYYIGIIFASLPFHFILLELLVGIYSALISGSYSSWFMNSWKLLSSKEDDQRFREIMGNMSFIKTLTMSLAIFIGGFLLQQNGIYPRTIFFIQAFIAAIGVVIGYVFISNPRINDTERITSRRNDINKKSDGADAVGSITRNLFKVLPYFLGFSFVGFTSIAFSTLVLIPYITAIFNQYQVATVSFLNEIIFIATAVVSISNLINAFASRFSARATRKIRSPYQGLLLFYFVIHPVILFSFILVLTLGVSTVIKIVLFVSLYFLKAILGGFSTGLFWQFYYDITSSKFRSSQESLYNTVSLLVTLVGYNIIGFTLDSYSLVLSLVFLLILSILGFVFLLWPVFWAKKRFSVKVIVPT